MLTCQTTYGSTLNPSCCDTCFELQWVKLQRSLGASTDGLCVPCATIQRLIAACLFVAAKVEEVRALYTH